MLFAASRSIVLFLFLLGDVSGHWVGSLRVAGSAGRQEGKLVLHLQQRATAVTGTAGTDEAHQSPIRNGVAHGDTTEFDVSWGNTAQFVLVRHGDTLSGEMHGDPREAPAGKHPASFIVSLERAP